MQEESFEKLIETYLASIPAVDQPQPLRLDRLTPLPVQFPEEVVKEDVRLATQEHQDAFPSAGCGDGTTGLGTKGTQR